jgi:hypothetical protein
MVLPKFMVRILFLAAGSPRAQSIARPGRVSVTDRIDGLLAAERRSDRSSSASTRERLRAFART